MRRVVSERRISVWERESQATASRPRRASHHDDFAVASPGGLTYLPSDIVNHFLNSWPIGCTDDNDSDVSRLQVLLILEVRIRGDQDVESVTLGSIEQFAVGQCGPAHLKCGGHVMLCQRQSQWNRNALIEEDAHYAGVRAL